VELFVRSLDIMFQNILNLRLSSLEAIKVDKFGRSRVENSYDFKYIIQKVVELISEKIT